MSDDPFSGGGFDKRFNLADELNFLYENRPNLQRLENAACIHAYSQPLQTKRGSLLAISPSTASNNSFINFVALNLVQV